MLYLYKRYRIGYMITALAGAFAFIGAFYAMRGRILLALIPALIWIFGCALFFSYAANKRYQKTILSLYNNCHIRDFIAENEKLLMHRKKNLADYLKLNLFSGYIALGDIQRAGETLFSIQPCFGKNMINWVYYYSGLCLLYLKTGDTEKAERALAAMKPFLDRIRVNSPQRAAAVTQWENKNVLLDMTRGNYDGAKKYYQMQMTVQEHMLGKVIIQHELGIICTHFGETEEAGVHYQFAAENGGDSYYAADAKEKLKRYAAAGMKE